MPRCWTPQSHQLGCTGDRRWRPTRPDPGGGRRFHRRCRKRSPGGRPRRDERAGDTRWLHADKQTINKQRCRWKLLGQRFRLHPATTNQVSMFDRATNSHFANQAQSRGVKIFQMRAVRSPDQKWRKKKERICDRDSNQERSHNFNRRCITQAPIRGN